MLFNCLTVYGIDNKRRAMRENDRIFISVKEAAATIRMSKEYLYQLIRRKKGPPVRRFGRTIRVPINEFMTWARKFGD